MNFPNIPSHVSVVPNSVYVPLQDMQITMEQPQVNARYRPADMEIHTKNADIQVDMQPVWDSIGLENSLQYAKSYIAKGNQIALDAIAQIAQDGRRVARSLTSGEKNVFGNIAMDKLQRGKEPELKITAIPGASPVFRVQIYQPEIHVVPHSPEVHPNDASPKFSFKTLQNPTSSFVDRRI